MFPKILEDIRKFRLLSFFKPLLKGGLKFRKSSAQNIVFEEHPFSVLLSRAFDISIISVYLRIIKVQVQSFCLVQFPKELAEVEINFRRNYAEHSGRIVLV